MGRKPKKEKASLESLELSEAVAGGCLEGTPLLTPDEADAALEAEDGFFRERIRRAEEWQEELERAEAAKSA